MKSSEAKVSLSKAELDLVVGKMSISANEIKTAVGNWVMDADYITTVAKRITTETDIATTVAGKINIQSLDYNLIASNIVTLSDTLIDNIVTNASGEIVAEIKADKDGLLGLFAENVVIAATKAGNGEGSYIQLLAESAAGQVAAQLSVGTNSEGASFIKAVAKEVDIIGTLKTQDIYINGGMSWFGAQGNGYVANHELSWDEKGNVEIGNSTGDYSANKFYTNGSGYVANKNFNWDANGNIGIGSDDANDAPTNFYADGSGHVANYNIKWDKDGNVTIGNATLSGVIQASLLYSDYMITSGDSSGVIDISSLKNTVLYAITPDSSLNKAYVKLPSWDTLADKTTLLFIYVDYNRSISISSTGEATSQVYLRITDDIDIHATCTFTGDNKTGTGRLKSQDVLLTNGQLYMFINLYNSWRLVNQTLTLSGNMQFQIVG